MRLYVREMDDRMGMYNKEAEREKGDEKRYVMNVRDQSNELGSRTNERRVGGRVEGVEREKVFV